MHKNILRERLLASSMICGAALAGLAASPAQAAAAASGGAEVSEIVVTGTRIPTPNLTSVAPVTSVSAADIKAQGVTRVEDLINSLPQVTASQGSGYSNASTGTAEVDLRGLGPQRTVVLVDGKRLQAGNPTSNATTAVAADVNFIPSSLVERVDVLTGGASAVYGADAVSGVINFIMNRNFEGVRLDAQYSFNQHNQHEGYVQSVLQAARARAAIPDNYSVPGDFKGGETSSVSLTLGVNAPDGKGNITAYANTITVNQILASNYDYTACALNSGDTFAAAGCGGSGTAYPARIGGFTVDLGGPGNTFKVRNPASDVYNYAPTNYLQRPDLRYGMGSFAHYEINPHFQAYADLMFMQDTSTYQIAPGGVFVGGGGGPGGAYQINCDNPLMSAQEQGLLCGANAGTPTLANVQVARRNVEGGPRDGEFYHVETRYVVGMKGQLAGDWTYDSYLQLGQTYQSLKQTHFFVTPRVNNALIAKRNAAGQIVCQSVIDGTDPGCVPYNIFAVGGVTQAALNYLQAPVFQSGHINEQIANFNVVGTLPEGVKSPMANDKIGVSMGAEYRREHLDFGSDFLLSNGLLNGNGGAIPSVNGGFDVYELFGEARVPLIQDQPWAKDITAELAYRYSDYSNAGVTNTYKIAGDWTVVDGFRVRGGYNRAVRAPNVVELFSPQNVVLLGTVDPCAGLAAGNPLVPRCAAAFNLTTAQVLAIPANTARQFNAQTGGNPNLKPEIADTYTFGVVWQPTFAPGFNLTVDYFNIKVDQLISTLGPDATLQGCVNGSKPQNCALVHRDAIGSLVSSQGFVTTTNQNLGGLRTSGVDVTAGYHAGLDTFGLQNMGSVSSSFDGTWTDKLDTIPQVGDPAIPCAGHYGAICLTPAPKWRHKLRVTWNTPFEYGWLGSLGLSAQWRYFQSVTLDITDPAPGLGGTTPGGPATDLKLGSRSYLDLLATFKIKDNYSFRIGVNNVLDQDPPLNGANACPTGPCNQNVWPQTYDSLGRYIFMGVTADF